MKRLLQLASGALPVCLAACHRGHDQSALHPASAEAASIATLWWVMFAVLATAFVIVMAFVLFAISRAPKADRAPGGATRFVVISAIVIPSFILVGLLVYSLQTTLALRRPVELQPPIVAIRVAHCPSPRRFSAPRAGLRQQARGERF